MSVREPGESQGWSYHSESVQYFGLYFAGKSFGSTLGSHGAYLDKLPAQCISRAAATIVLHSPELVQVVEQLKLVS